MLISMAVWDTEENGRTGMTRKTLESLAKTVNWDRHRLFITDNGSCDDTIRLFHNSWVSEMLPFEMTRLEKNIGTARAINKGWEWRMPGEHCVKMDNDVVFHQPDWADWMEDVFERDPTIGICGLKRKDLDESPFAEGDMKSSVRMLPHEKGQRWLVVEDVNHVIGTCQAYSSALLDKIGYLTQPSRYGFDDSLSAVRCRLAGFKSVFLHGFEIDHIDPGGDEYCNWKRAHAAKFFSMYESKAMVYETGLLDLWCGPDGDR